MAASNEHSPEAMAVIRRIVENCSRCRDNPVVHVERLLKLREELGPPTFDAAARICAARRGIVDPTAFIRHIAENDDSPQGAQPSSPTMSRSFGDVVIGGRSFRTVEEAYAAVRGVRRGAA